MIVFVNPFLRWLRPKEAAESETVSVVSCKNCSSVFNLSCYLILKCLWMLKVNKNRNDFMKTLFGLKSNVIFVRISEELYNRAKILTKNMLLFGPNDIFMKSFWFLLSFTRNS